MNTRKTRNVTMFLLFIILCLLLLYLIGRNEKKKSYSIIKDGTEAIGTIVNRTKGTGDGDMTVYGIHFDFIADGVLIKSSQRLNGKIDYERAFVGMKYRVKYLQNNPSKNSILFLNNPILDEKVNIPEERERILRTYENGDVFLKKNAQSLEEIKLYFKNQMEIKPN